MNIIKSIIVLSITVTLSTNVAFLRPSERAENPKALNIALKSKRAQKAYEGYESLLKLSKLPQMYDLAKEQAKEQAVIIISTPYLTKDEQQAIALWAANTLTKQFNLAPGQSTAELAQDLLNRAQEIYNEKMKISIIEKIKTNAELQNATVMEILTNKLFSLKERELLAEHFAILTRNPHQSDQLIFFNDLDELAKQMNLEDLTDIKRDLLTRANEEKGKLIINNNNV